MEKRTVDIASDIVELPGAGDPRRTTSSLGMIIFLASWTMMFASLFASYGMLRFRAVTWPPTDAPPLPVGQGAFNTLAILLSSVCLQYAIYAIRRGNARHCTPSLLLGTCLAIAFLVLQVVSWVGLWQAGLVPSTGQYASTFYLLTVFHGLHVGVGIVALGWLCFRALRGAYTPTRHLPLSMWAYYWHFVGAVWVLMYVLVYLV